MVVTPNTDRYRQLREAKGSMDWLLEEAFVLREDGSGTRREALAYLKELGIEENRLRIVANFANSDAVLMSVREGIGISVLSEVAVREMVRGGKLLSFPLEGIMPQPLYFVSKKKLLSPAQVEFRDFILEAAEREE